MTTNESFSQSKGQRWGWRILVAVSGLLVLNGVILYFVSTTAGVFEQDTGVPMDEVREKFPTVVDQVVQEDQTISILLSTIGLMGLVAALEGSRRRTRWAWNSFWILFAMVLIVGVRAVLGGQGFGYYYLVMSVVLLTGQLLAGKELTS